MITALKNLAPKNPVVWDIGANAGFFVAALAQNLEGYACILMFEPNDPPAEYRSRSRSMHHWGPFFAGLRRGGSRRDRD